MESTRSSAAEHVVVMADDLSRTALTDLDARGARGIRFITMVHGGQSIDALKRLADEVAPLGRHIQLWAAPATWRGRPDRARRGRRRGRHPCTARPARLGARPRQAVLLPLLPPGPPYDDVRPLVGSPERLYGFGETA